MSNIPRPAVALLSAEDKHRKRIQELDEAFEEAKRKKGRLLSVQEEKNLRRSVSNHLSLKKKRLENSQHVEELGNKITELELTIGNLRPEVENLQQSNAELRVENSMLEEKLKKWTDYSNCVDAQIKEKTAEKILLKEYREVLKTINFNEASCSGRVVGQPEPVEVIEPEPEPEPVEDIEPEPEPEPVEDIEQYLNLDALYMSNATKNSDI